VTTGKQAPCLSTDHQLARGKNYSAKQEARTSASKLAGTNMLADISKQWTAAPRLDRHPTPTPALPNTPIAAVVYALLMSDVSTQSADQKAAHLQVQGPPSTALLT
jgi:hypothetical protein